MGFSSFSTDLSSSLENSSILDKLVVEELTRDQSEETDVRRWRANLRVITITGFRADEPHSKIIGELRESPIGKKKQGHTSSYVIMLQVIVGRATIPL